MAVTWLQVPDVTLPTTSAPVAFVATAPLSYVIVGFGSDRSREPAYHDGAFVYPYLGSSKVGSVYTLVRSGGWPAKPRVYVEESSAVVAPAYTPLDPTAWGQWTLDRADLGANRIAGRPQLYWGVSDQGWAPDIVPDKTFYHPWVDDNGAGYGGSQGLEIVGGPKPPNAAAGAHTLAGRFYIHAFPGIDQTLLGIIADYPTARIAFGLTYNAQIFTLQYGQQRVLVPTQSLVWPRDGKWHYASARFDGAGNVRFGVDAAFVTVAGGTYLSQLNAGPLPGAACMVTVCQPPGGYNMRPTSKTGNFWGGAADIGAWGRSLSDAEIVANASIALGKALS